MKSGSSITVGVISSFTIYSSQFSKPFIELSGITTQLQTAFSGLERAFDLIDQPEETPDLPDAYALEPKNIKGKVSFDQVSFSYEPKQRSIQRDTLRKSFGMVLQDTWLFDSTLRENLRFGNPEASDAEINDALKASYMYEFVERLPEKLDTKIGGQGLKISDGQRQLLTIARTMISNPPMLILDEATSSVDTLTEKKIQQAFLAMMEGKTSFVIAHRLSTIKKMVITDGSIKHNSQHNKNKQSSGMGRLLVFYLAWIAKLLKIFL